MPSLLSRLAPIALLLAAVPGHTEPFDPAALKPAMPGPASELMVLGTPHLSGWPETFRPAALDGLIDRLAGWRPAIIAIEAVPGIQCDMLRRNPARYAESVKDYCPETADAKAATGLDVPEAIAQADRLLADWPEAPMPAQRRRLAALFLAAGDPTSALVQWLRLPEAERRAGEGLDAALVARLDALQTRRNEDMLIAAPLAARLGLERVHPMDDHSADSPVADEQGFEAAIRKAWDNPAVKQRDALDARLLPGIGSSAGVLTLYRAYNAPEVARLVYDSDFGAALGDPSPQRFGRGYVAGWETRNLRMAANIRDAMAPVPGARTLVIVGVSHKWYLEAYLDRMHDVHIADVDPVLR